MGLKIYSIARGAARFVVLLYKSTTGEMVALIEADALGQIRTGAASGVATKYLANEDAGDVGIIGTGYQARSQLEAVGAVRRLRRVRAFGRDPERRARFCREMSDRVGISVEAVESGEQAVRGADIVITATSANKIVLEGDWLAPGSHLNVMGANWPQKREVDNGTVARAGVIAVDSVEQAKLEAGDLIQAFDQDSARWDSVRPLSDIVAGTAAGRSATDQITLFKSVGIATWDIAVATRVYEAAIVRGIGTPIPLWAESQQP